ncbi:MAG: RHS repeat-associated core domain-containing protein [Acidobacteriota bacterium]
MALWVAAAAVLGQPLIAAPKVIFCGSAPAPPPGTPPGGPPPPCGTGCGAPSAGGGSGDSPSGSAGAGEDGAGAGNSSSGTSAGEAGGSGRGSPVYVINGNFVTQASDLSLPTAGFPLTVRRVYNSGRPGVGPFGVGWTSTITVKLFRAEYLYSAPSTRRVEAEISAADGFLFRFQENADGVTYMAPAGRRDVLVRNGDGTYDLTEQGTRSRDHFAADGRLLSFTDDFGNLLNFAYDGAGRLTAVSDASGSGRYINVFYGANGRISSLQDSASRQVQYTYDAAGMLTRVVDAAGRTTNYGYATTPIGQLLSSVSDGFGRVASTIAYDTAAHASTVSENGETYTYTYNFNGAPNRTNKQAAGTDNRWQFVYTPEGQITDRIRIYGSLNTTGPTIHTDYNPDFSVAQITDEVGVKTAYTYDVNGRVASVTRDFQGPQAIRFDYSYDPAFPNKVISVTPKDPSTGQVNRDWQETRYDYHQAGAPAPGTLYHTYRVRTDGSSETLSANLYDSRGQLTQTTTAAGGQTDYAYDAAGNLATVTRPSNNDGGIRVVTTYTYDLAGRVTRVTDPLGRATTYVYDGADRAVSVTLPKPSVGFPMNFTTTYVYDGYDSVTGLVFTSVTDPNGRVTRQGYDPWGRIRKSVNALGNATTYTYVQGVLRSVQDANGNLTTFTYDDLSHVLLRTDRPDGTPHRYVYTADRLLAEDYPPTNWRLSTYDRLKRLVRLQTPGTTYSYTYVGQKLTQVIDNLDAGIGDIQTHTYGYDPSYRLSQNVQGSQGTLSYTYTPEDAVASYAVQGGPTTTLTYYPDGSVNTIAWTPVAGLFKYRYTLAGQYQQVTFPNGSSRVYSYDDQDRLLQLAHTDPVAGNLATYGYGYDLNYTTGAYTMLGQRVSMIATVPAQGFLNHLTKYEYDPHYQLTKATYPNVTPFNGEIDAWTYDGIGNRTTSAVNGAVTAYTYATVTGNPGNWQRLLSDGANTYTYTANGDTATRSGPAGNLTFGWGWENRLVGISGAVAAAYRYDHEGRRISKATGGPTTNYLYNGLNLIQESGATSAGYLFGPGIDEPLAMSRGGQTYYYSVDALGSAVLVTNAGGTVQNKYVYDAWGEVKAQAVTLVNPFVYTGREQGEAGTLFYRARFLTPAIGRFLQGDPLGGGRGMGRFNYLQNDPIDMKDPFGLFAVSTNCKQSPFQGPVQAGIADLCGSRTAPGSPCDRALRNISSAMTGDPNTIPGCYKRMCQGRTVGIDCDPKCPSCARSAAAEGIVLGPGNPGCPNQPPNPVNNFQGGGSGQPIGIGETIFHETFHWCATWTEPSASDPVASYFRYAEAACYGWRDTGAPPVRNR